MSLSSRLYRRVESILLWAVACVEILFPLMPPFLLLSFFSRHFTQQLTHLLKVGKCTNWQRKNWLAPPLLPCPRPPRQSYHSIAPALPLPAAHQILISQVTPGVSCLAPGLSVDMLSPPPRPPSLHLSLANFLPAILYPQHVSLSGPQASSLPPPASQPAGGVHVQLISWRH